MIVARQIFIKIKLFKMKKIIIAATFVAIVGSVFAMNSTSLACVSNETCSIEKCESQCDTKCETECSSCCETACK